MVKTADGLTPLFPLPSVPSIQNKSSYHFSLLTLGLRKRPTYSDQLHNITSQGLLTVRFTTDIYRNPTSRTPTPFGTAPIFVCTFPSVPTGRKDLKWILVEIPPRLTPGHGESGQKVHRILPRQWQVNFLRRVSLSSTWWFVSFDNYLYRRNPKLYPNVYWKTNKDFVYIPYMDVYSHLDLPTKIGKHEVQSRSGEWTRNKHFNWFLRLI